MAILKSIIFLTICESNFLGCLLGREERVGITDTLPIGALLTHLQIVAGLKPKYLAACLKLFPDLTMSNYRMEALTPEGALVGTVGHDHSPSPDVARAGARCAEPAGV